MQGEAKAVVSDLICFSAPPCPSDTGADARAAAGGGGGGNAGGSPPPPPLEAVLGVATPVEALLGAPSLPPPFPPLPPGAPGAPVE